MLGLVSCPTAAGSKQADITNIEPAKTATEISEVTVTVVFAFLVCIFFSPKFQIPVRQYYKPFLGRFKAKKHRQH
jgi:hypothetical protein